MFGHDPGQHDRPGNVFNIPPSAGVSQAEACRMMGVSNLMVCIWSQPGEEYLRQFKGLKRVSWAVENGWTKQVMKREIYAKQMPYVENLFKKMPNLVGVDFDDWFYMEPRPESAFETLECGRREVVAAGPMSERELRQARRRIASWGRPADMRLIVYSRDVPVPGILPVIDVFDTVTFWTWDAADLARLRENFAMYRKFVPEKPTLLGMYMWDFGGKKPIGVDTMRRQLDFALEKFRCGEIDGVIFHCTPLVDKNIPEVEMCRKWIADHGQEHIGRRDPSAAKREPFPIDMPLPEIENNRPAYDWFERHQSRVELARKTNPQIVFIGDSITHGWEANDRRGDAKGTFDRWFGKYSTLNLGFGWDRIQNVLWRLEHGEMDRTNPKVVVIHIGTNNTAPGYRYNAAPNPPGEVADGILAVCRKVRDLAPNARIVLMKVFPRGKTSADPYRGKVAAVNAELDRKLADFHDNKLTVLDMYDKFVDKDGNISLDLTIDYLHPTAKGYDLWAEALAPLIEAECGKVALGANYWASHDRSYWALNAGCWLLEHFQRIKNSFYLASAGRRNF